MTKTALHFFVLFQGGIASQCLSYRWTHLSQKCWNEWVKEEAKRGLWNSSSLSLLSVINASKTPPKQTIKHIEECSWYNQICYSEFLSGSPALVTRKPCKKFSCEVDAYADLTLEFYPIAPETPENSGFSSFTQDTNPKKSDVFLEIWSFKPRYSDFVLYVFLSLLNILVYFIFTFNQRTKL